MRALFFDGSAVRFRRNHPEPALEASPTGATASGEVLIRVLAAGICQTDHEIARGYMGFTGILGHEFVGTVVKVGAGVDPQWIGRRVCGEINCVCGKCAMCARGLSSHCLNRTVLGIQNRDGAFADFLKLPARNLHAVPDHVSNEEAVFVEPLAAAFQILRQIPIEKRTRVTVFGDGRLGLLVAQVLQRTGCALTLVGKHEDKLAVVERLGGKGAGATIRTVLDVDLTTARDQDVVVDCTGRASGFERALQLVRPRGTLVLKTTVAGRTPLNLAPIVIDEINLLGSRCGPFPEAISALAAREVQVLPLISRRLTPEQVESYFAPENAVEGLKTLINFER